MTLVKKSRKQTPTRPVKKKSDPTTHVTISVPNKLRKRMLRFQSEFLVNWSAVASSAFRQHIKRKRKEHEAKT